MRCSSVCGGRADGIGICADEAETADTISNTNIHFACTVLSFGTKVLERSSSTLCSRCKLAAVNRLRFFSDEGALRMDR